MMTPLPPPPPEDTTSPPTPGDPIINPPVATVVVVVEAVVVWNKLGTIAAPMDPMTKPIGKSARPNCLESRDEFETFSKSFSVKISLNNYFS